MCIETLQVTCRLVTFIQFLDVIMTVLAVNRRKNVPECFSRRIISNETFECRLRVQVNVILNVQMEHEKKNCFFESRHPLKHVDLFKQNCTKIQALNERGTNSAKRYVSGWGGVCPIFKIYLNEIQRRHNITFILL